MAQIALNKPSGGQLLIQPEDGTSTETVTIPSVGVGKVLQVVHDQTTVWGAVNGGGPNEASGLLLSSVNFTPKSTASKIIVITSTIMAHEHSNSGDIGWLGAWADQYQIGVNSATARYSSFAGSLNAGHYSLSHSIDSWGTTQRTIRVRAGCTAGTFYINYNGSYDTAESFREFGVTIMEVSA